MGSGETAVTMVSSLAILPLLASLSAAQLPVPGSIPGLSIDQQYQYIQQLQNHLNTQVQWSGRRKRSLPVPGTTGLVPGSAAEAQWYQQQLAALAPAAPLQYTSASLPVSGTIPGLAPGSAAEAQWYQQQLAAIAAAGRKKRSLPVPGTIPGLIPGSEAEAQWYAAQLKLIALQG